MANIPLKTLTFPNIPNTYTVPYFLTYDKILSKDAWIGDSAPYSQSITLTGVEGIQHIKAVPTFYGALDADVALSESCSMISYATYAGNVVTFKCLSEKPEVDVPVQLEVRL